MGPMFCNISCFLEAMCLARRPPSSELPVPASYATAKMHHHAWRRISLVISLWIGAGRGWQIVYLWLLPLSEASLESSFMRVFTCAVGAALMFYNDSKRLPQSF